MGCSMKTNPPEIKKRIVDAVRQGYPKSLVAKMFGVSRKTVWSKGKDECLIKTLCEEYLPLGPACI
jgi:DNA invertase Pin-like site-specific DNA recombinase